LNTKTLGVTVTFTAVTTALDLIQIPMPLMPGFLFRLGDIVLIIVLLLFGIVPAVAVATLNMLITIALSFSAAGPIGPAYNLIPILAMLVGVYFFERAIKTKLSPEKKSTLKTIGFSTSLGVLTRTLVMLPLDYFVYGFLVSVVSGLSISASYELVRAALPGIVAYNIAVPIVMVPAGYFVVMRVSRYRASIN
jgi:riboflavin transporter FmnP